MNFQGIQQLIILITADFLCPQFSQQEEQEFKVKYVTTSTETGHLLQNILH